MPYAAFATNFLWVMVIGLLGPSVPAIIGDLGISYSQAGLFFTLLSLGSVFGTSIGATASDYVNRKAIYAGFAGVFAIGLISIGFVPGYAAVCIVIFLFSLFGSPIGAIGQSAMLDMFPDKRGQYLSIQTFFAALGSFIAPLIVSLNVILKLNWRWSFIETAGLVIICLLAILFVKIPNSSAQTDRVPVKKIIRNPNIIIAAVLIFFSVALDLGFSYWLAEYFKTELKVSLRLSSAIVSIYLIGVISGRLSASRMIKYFPSKNIMGLGLGLGFVSLLIFILVPVIPVKVIFACLYGLGISPVFPLVMAKGVEEYPKQPGTVTGVLFACMSLGGMVFPLLLGILATRFGIERSYFFNLLIVAAVFTGLMIWIKKRKVLSRRGDDLPSN